MLGKNLLRRVLWGINATKPATKPIEVPEIASHDTTLAIPTPIAATAPIEVVHQDVKDLVDKIIFSDSDTSRVGHLFRELMQLHDVKWEVQTGTTSISINLKGEPKKNISIEKICLGILKDFAETEYNREWYSSDTEIKFKHFSIKLSEESYPTRLQLVIKMSKSIGEKELTLLKEVFEKNILKNGNFAANLVMDEDFIADRLGLKDTDIIILDAKTLKIKKFTEENSIVDISEVLTMASGITSRTKYQDTCFINIHPDISNSWGTSHQHFNVAVTSANMSDIVAFDVIIEKKSISFNITLPNNSFDRTFVTSFLVPFTKEIQQLVTAKNQESIAGYLEKMGVRVQENSEEDQHNLSMLYEREWFVGYEDIKDHIENGVIHAWKNKAKFEEIAREKYKNIKDIVPNAVLFEWPAGTGKTTLARIIGSHLNYPFVYIPLNSFMSKWYGEAEQRLAKIFEKIGELAKQKGGVVIMIDEIDEIGGDREKSHEATGKITGVLLKKLDGMERIDNILLIGATNRKDTLDAALLSRFKYSQFFRLPNESEISQIVTHYLPILSHIPPESFTPFVGKISGRNLKNICEDTTRIAIQNEIVGNEIDLKEVFLKSMARSVES